jgi:hypothetical protein
VSLREDAQAALEAYDDVPGKGVDRSGWTRDDRDFAREQQRSHLIRTAPRVADALRALLSVAPEPPTTDEQIEAAAEQIDRVFGWQHLRRYKSPSPEWMDSVRDAMARAALEAAAPIEGAA